MNNLPPLEKQQPLFLLQLTGQMSPIKLQNTKKNHKKHIYFIKEEISSSQILHYLIDIPKTRKSI